MRRLIVFAFLLLISQSPLHCNAAASGDTPTQRPNILLPHADIKSRKFQTHFIDELNALVDTAAGDHLNGLLQELRANKDYVAYVSRIESAASATQLMPKIVYLKQLLDLKLNEPPHSVESYYTVRNLNFLGKLKRQLLQLQEESATELRHLRWYNLCGQFWYRDILSNQTQTAAHQATPRPPAATHYWANVKLAPLRAETVVASTTATDATPLAHIELERFARLLYANVKAAGAELIDDYLFTVRKLLQEVIEEKHIAAMSSTENEEGKLEPSTADSHTLHASKLSKVLTEIDTILAIDDFYAKRNRLYSYLENDLSTDYEQFKNSQYANEDLAEMLAKLQRKGVDLFVTFIFSNFEFLEHLHDTWRKLLPWPTNAHETPLQYDASSQRLFDVHRLYVEFKRDWENSERYNAYQGVVQALYAETRNGSANMHIFELLNNASANVGTVTLNMIKAKCDEL
ncbi:uncharacterized protein LOC126753583 [Bactrocera neohumeralis]|uniref:uncharacterized protein LOC126753583 n=1 Tax=Bactrocera neohumeralis TaxID=98809 RepID=UPI00216527F3|nr:uncharacterized protein LOC126753583 [Bactrocera neohumeralis]